LSAQALELARAELRAAHEEAITLATVPARFDGEAREIAALLRDLDAATETEQAATVI
jgi:hypothetical protein